MTTRPKPPSPPLTDHDRLVGFLDQLLRSSIRRQLWLFFLDADSRLISPVCPHDGFPDDPEERVLTDDLGELTAAQFLAARFAELRQDVDAAEIVLVWERQGSHRLTRRDRAWARALGAAVQALELGLRAQLLLSSAGHRIITPDDLA